MDEPTTEDTTLQVMLTALVAPQQNRKGNFACPHYHHKLQPHYPNHCGNQDATSTCSNKKSTTLLD